MMIIPSLISIGIVAIVIGSGIAWIFWSINKDEHSAEYMKGYRDYPDQRMYDTVAFLRHSDDKIHNYCNGYESAAHAEDKMIRESLKDKFNEHIQ